MDEHMDEVPEEALTDREEDTEFKTELLDSDSEPKELGAKTSQSGKVFGESLGLLQLSHTEVVLLRRTFELFVTALGHDREAVGDALYGALTSALATLQSSFTTPKAVLSLRLFNGFRILSEKCEDPEDLKNYVESLAFKHLGIEVTQQRAEQASCSILELIEQNVEELPPGGISAWQEMLTYASSSFKYVNVSYGERLKLIHTDWADIQLSVEEEEDETVVRSFPKMCAFSVEVMGQETQSWMEELLKVFKVLVEKVSSPAQLTEECDLLAISIIAHEKVHEDIQFETFKPVMMSALRSLLPKQWSTSHETAWEWLWETISRNLKEATMKVRAFRPFNAKLFSSLKEEQLEIFRSTIYEDFFTKCAASQDLFKQSQSRLRYIADKVLQSSYDMYHKPKNDMVDYLSALGLRHVGYGVPIELFGPFTDSCVQVMKPLIEELPKPESTTTVWCPADRAHQLLERDVPMHMMVEGFRWSLGLVSRVLLRTIVEGSTSVMQAIHQDNAKRLRQALQEAPRAERYTWQLGVRVGSQSISPLYWALQTGAHETAKEMLRDLLTIRADRDRYYYGVNELFQLQPDIVENILHEAPGLAETFLDGLIWRSHKTFQGTRPVIYYLEHLLQDMDESKTLSRAMISFVKFQHPATITHPILTFTLDLLWQNLVMRFFLFGQLTTNFNFLIFILATCVLNNPALEGPNMAIFLALCRLFMYFLGMGRLLYWHSHQSFRAFAGNELVSFSTPFHCKMAIPKYLFQGTEMMSFFLMVDLLCMLGSEPIIHCIDSEQLLQFRCEAWTEGLQLAYAVFLVIGVFLYVFLVSEVGHVSIELSQYRVLCQAAAKQILLCLGAVAILVLVFALAITGMLLELSHSTTISHEWEDMGSTITTLTQMTVGIMDLSELHHTLEESPFLFVILAIFMLMVYSFFFNLLISQFCGVYSSLAVDVTGYARLARGEIIVDILKEIPLSRWQRFLASLTLQKRVDFEEGDLGLAGGIKTFEPALDHPVTQDQIVRFGGQTDPSLPWPEKVTQDNTIESLIQRTIQKSLQKMLGKKHAAESDTSSSMHSSSLHG